MASCGTNPRVFHKVALVRPLHSVVRVFPPNFAWTVVELAAVVQHRLELFCNVAAVDVLYALIDQLRIQTEVRCRTRVRAAAVVAAVERGDEGSDQLTLAGLER